MENFLQRERKELKTRWTRVMILLTCLAMILVVAQQGGTIDTQRSLIRLLWDDSRQLNKIRVEELNKEREKMYLTDPNYGRDKTPSEKAAPAPKRTPAVPDKPMRVLRQI